MEKYRNPRANEGESVCNFVQTFGLSHLKRVLSCLTPPPFIGVSVYSVSIAESEWLYIPVCYVHTFLAVSTIVLLDLGIVPTLWYFFSFFFSNYLYY